MPTTVHRYSNYLMIEMLGSLLKVCVVAGCSWGRWWDNGGGGLPKEVLKSASSPPVNLMLISVQPILNRGGLKLQLYTMTDVTVTKCSYGHFLIDPPPLQS